ncbi:hypothetical protein [Nostoc parmelioides]|uniref:hypothetical protein n=1 Tax=Nostoc parmelioides TaxID=1521621 RepID=UPI001F550BEE|nr:hypothetical protein [Nostoc parmelioides]
MREIPCTPQFRLNGEIQRTVKRYWENVPEAIAYLKEAVRTWKGIKSPEAVFVAACKEERKPEAQQVKSEAIASLRCASPSPMESTSELEDSPTANDCTSLALVDDAQGEFALLIVLADSI